MTWVLAVLAAGCGGPVSADARSAVLITLDTTRADALSCYGQALPTTPALDRLAAEGVRYTQCRTVAPITVPAHASMLTGLLPPEHGLRNNGLGALPAEAVTVAERANEAGLATAAFVAALVLDREVGLDQGFDRYDQPERPRQRYGNHFVERGADEMAELALAWLAERGDERFFLWLHLFDPHAPWEVEPSLVERFSAAGPRAPYLAEVAAADAAVGRVLEHLEGAGRLADTAVLVVADHGEGLGDHGEGTHSALIYDSTVRVPLILRYPDGYGAGTEDGGSVSVVDVAPTLCEALGLPALDGASSARSLWRRSSEAGRGTYFESWVGYLNFGWAPLVGGELGGRKLIHDAERPELFAVREDPGELTNLAATPQDVPAPLADWVREAAERAPIARVAALETADRLAELAALGYATAAAPELELPSPFEASGATSGETSGRPRAADRIDELRSYFEACDLMAAGDLRAAVATFDRLVQENPGHVAALDRLGHCFVLVEGWPEAIEIFEQRLARAEGPGSTYVNLALAYEHTDRLPEAEAALVRALELSPASGVAAANLERVRGLLSEQ